MLANGIERLAMELFPAGKRDNQEWRVGSLAGEPGKSLAICIKGSKAGVWRDFAGGPSGDALDLVAHTLYRGDLGEALSWALGWLGLDDNPVPARSASQPWRARSTTKSDHAEFAKRLEFAKQLWAEARPAKESIVETYLESRGLKLPDVRCLRFHPSCPYGPRNRLPVMLALMIDPVTAEPCGVHRTPLLHDGSGRPPDVDKKMMGKAGVVRLSDEGYDNGRLGIAEGIETALSVIQRGGWSPVWAACAAGGIERFPVLLGVECLTIFADHDIAGLNAARDCSRRWRLGGREVRIVAPRDCGNWNDAALGRAT